MQLYYSIDYAGPRANSMEREHGEHSGWCHARHAQATLVRRKLPAEPGLNRRLERRKPAPPSFTAAKALAITVDERREARASAVEQAFVATARAHVDRCGPPP